MITLVPENPSGTKSPSSESLKEFDLKTSSLPTTIGEEAPQPGAVAVTPAPAEGTGWPPALIGMILGFLFMYLSHRLGAHWAMNDLEKKELGELGKVVADKWIPVGTAGPEVAFAVALGGALVPRVALTDWKEVAAKQKQALNSKTGKSAGSPATSEKGEAGNPFSWQNEFGMPNAS